MDESVARQLLATSQAATGSQIEAMSAELDRLAAASADSNLDDEHDPEGATVGFERAQLTALLARQRQQLAAIEQALNRLATGSYGRCEQCGRPVGDDRLEAIPTARLCISCARSSRATS